MHPYIFGFLDSYVVMIVIGIALGLTLSVLYLKFIKFPKLKIYEFLINGLIAIIAGIIFANLFQNLYDLINDPTHFKYSFGLTFYGGLIGGVGTYFLFYFLYTRKRAPEVLKEAFIIAPAVITLAHAFGRIGCFLDGCCYGIETDNWIGVKFPDLPNKVIPTQLIESVFLFILAAIFITLAFKKKFIYSMPLYMLSYSIFRFVIEFYRGDYRGKILLGLSPSQYICILLFIGSFVCYFLLKKYYGKKEEEQNT